MADGWTTLTKAQQSYARKIMTWAQREGAAVNTSTVAKDLDTWDAAYRAKKLPPGTPMVEATPPDPAALRAERDRLVARIAEIDELLAR